ncbi:GFA family protein [Aliiglaciecola sp. 2_MG-2023]|uniref:GFA family protein n=1 Tax=Alteromonadaceae TaxID=72275 RepID=UPI0026E3ED79|nr:MULTISPECIES: GFA family protein [unclassified Aliiglaciecola]MDO6712801.1 GFA family protein [Aliiglaciecola sp. 2_MG-2023]MDO6753896.1 GFA family protein [Aliiglaciecola sp. 1_MG-2023]
MSNKHNGSCLCGSVKYELCGEFQSFFLCYCSRCQKDTGSAHAANLFAKSSTLTWLQGENEVVSYQHPNTLHQKSFCKICGSAVPTISQEIDSIVVPAGSLDGPVAIFPTAKIFVGSCANWVTNLSNVTSFEKLPGQSDN